MQIGQFIYGMVNGTIERKQTPNVDKLLSEKSLKILYDLDRNKQEINEATYIYTWDGENAITKTTIKPVSDKDGRSDMLNHTTIIKFDNILNDILDFTNILEVVEKGLEPLKVETK